MDNSLWKIKGVKMARRNRRRKSKQQGVSGIENRTGKAKPHDDLVSGKVHLFADDQNLFFGIINQQHGKDFRIDFGELMLVAARDSAGKTRGVASAFIAGVVPDDDSFWEVAKNQGWKVGRGYLGQANRSKQDDAHIITEMVSTLYEEEGPATLVLVAGDADYAPPLRKAIEKGWRTEVAFIDRGVSIALEAVTHEIRTIIPSQIERMEF